MKNALIAQIFHDIATILEIKGENRFRVRAYERAALNIGSLNEDIENYIKDNRLTDISGIGADLSEKIKEIVRTGRLKYYNQLKKTIPQGVLELLKIPSVGPKTAKLLYEELKIESIPALERAIKQKKLEGTFGIKEKTIENMLSGIQILKRGKERLTLPRAINLADQFIDALKSLKETENLSIAGSLRRRKETVHDIDMLVVSRQPAKIMDTFTTLPIVKEILAKGATKAAIRTENDTQVDCRVVRARSFGAALLYFTGSKNFNIKIRQMAIKKGFKINEYGVFKGDKYVTGESEEEIFKLLGMSYVPAELREDNGEIELALSSSLPKLIEIKDLKADLHLHSRWSDGSNSIEDMVKACQKKGYSYCAITDHSQSLKIAGGLSTSDLKKKKKEIDKINSRLKNFRVLYGAEVDIDSEGKLDYSQDVLKEFDLVIAAIHTGFKQSKQQLTKRIVAACKNKYAHIIAHPTGRLWGSRQAYDLNFEEIFNVARETNTAFEINSFPDRLDLNDLNCRRAKEVGVKIAISTDSHAIEQLDNIKYGIFTARRGWLGAHNVINTLAPDEFLRTIKK